MVSKRNAHQRTELSAASAVLLCRLFSAVTYLTIDEMQMIAKKVTYSYDCRAVGAKGASGAFDHPSLKGSPISRFVLDLGRNSKK